MNENNEYLHFRIKADGLDFTVEEANDIEFAPVRHGYWIRKVEYDNGIKREYFICSECEQTKMLNFHHYCPNCGAKMDVGTG